MRRACNPQDFGTLSGPDLKQKRREIEAQKRELDRMLATLTMAQTQKTTEERRTKRETIAAHKPKVGRGMGYDGHGSDAEDVEGEAD